MNGTDYCIWASHTCDHQPVYAKIDFLGKILPSGLSMYKYINVALLVTSTTEMDSTASLNNLIAWSVDFHNFRTRTISWSFYHYVSFSVGHQWCSLYGLFIILTSWSLDNLPRPPPFWLNLSDTPFFDKTRHSWMMLMQPLPARSCLSIPFEENNEHKLWKFHHHITCFGSSSLLHYPGCL